MAGSRADKEAGPIAKKLKTIHEVAKNGAIKIKMLATYNISFQNIYERSLNQKYHLSKRLACSFLHI